MATFIASHWPNILSITIAVTSLALTIILNRREKPSLMPGGTGVNIEIGRISFDWKNTSDFNLHNLSILISGFSAGLDEAFHFEDRYNFSVAKNSTFNYGWNLGPYGKETFYFRVRFKGTYTTRWPVFSERSFEQCIWYTVSKHAEKEEGDDTKIFFSVDTTHKGAIEELEVYFVNLLIEHEQAIDMKFEPKC